METTENNQGRSPSFELSAILAHEIKNPMNSIIINMAVLRSAVLELTGGVQSSAAGRAQKYLDVIEGEIRRLDKVIKGFLDFASPQQSTKTKFDLNQTILNIVEFLSQEMKLQKVQVDLDLASDLPLFLGSPDQLKQAIMNLLLNSLQAMPSGGKLSIRTSEEDHKALQIKIDDSGLGIEEKVRSRIFDPYFTTKAKGSGLGLAIVKRVVKAHGGNIEVQSELGKGTSFILRFPLTDTEKQTANDQ